MTTAPKTSFRFDDIKSLDDIKSWITKNPKPDAKGQGHNIYIGAALGQLGPRVQMCKYLGPRCRMIKVHDVMDNDNKKNKDERTISFFLPADPDTEQALKCIETIQNWASGEVKKKWIEKWGYKTARAKADNDALAAKGLDPKLLTDEEVKNMNKPQPGVWGGSLLVQDRDDETKYAPLMRVKGYFKEIEKIDDSPYEKMLINEDGEIIEEGIKIQPTEFLKAIEQVGTEFVPTIEFVKIYRKNLMWQISAFIVGGTVVPLPKRENKTIRDQNEEDLLKAKSNKRKNPDSSVSSPPVTKEPKSESDGTSETPSDATPPPAFGSSQS
jgi:hypothetical protein